MSGAPERKYTDADVRADPELAEMALEYLETYTGDFDPLVRARGVLASGRLLTTALTRVVLNCMRNDWDIADKMPKPMAQVIDMPVRDETEVYGYMQPAKKKKKVPNWTERYVDCGSPDLHPPHSYEKDGFDQWRCGGLANDRPDHLWIDAKIKTPYVKAKGGKMVHLVGEGSNFHWYPNRYGIGYGSLVISDSLWMRFPPDLNVKLLCKYPSWLRNPLLLREVPEGLITNDGTPIGLCPHCKKVRNAPFKDCGLGCKTLGTHTFNIECHPPKEIEQ